MSNPLIEIFDEQLAVHRMRYAFAVSTFDEHGNQVAKLEMYRRQRVPTLFFDDANPDAMPRHAMHDQITIADVALCESLRGHGLFRDFLAHVVQSLHGLEALQLQCVLSPWLRDKLEADPTWVRQSAKGANDFNPSYVKLVQ